MVWDKFIVRLAGNPAIRLDAEVPLSCAVTAAAAGVSPWAGTLVAIGAEVTGG
jgi:hypothetical protein